MSDTIGLPPINKRLNKKPSNLKKSMAATEPKFVSFEDQFKKDKKEEATFEKLNGTWDLFFYIIILRNIMLAVMHLLT